MERICNKNAQLIAPQEVQRHFHVVLSISLSAWRAGDQTTNEDLIKRVLNENARS